MDTKNLDKLSDEKRLKVLNAGILCFSRSGYTKTAISEIAAEAGVSKAAIFHYFGTKENLYIFLFNYISDELLAGLMAIIAEGIDDFFECAIAFMQVRLQLCEKHPRMFELLRLHAQKTDYEETKKFGAIENEKIQKGISMLFAKVDWSRFQDCYDRNTISNLASWIETGCLAELDKTMTIEEVHTEMKRYLQIMKKAVYKPGFQ